ncbi:hypothetical protein [Streptomyces litmocidini]|uniref:hypothetical protein n=1 Tax=Streptomyces litmocidini TaxID=67318 RepID=UPI0036F55E33
MLEPLLAGDDEASVKALATLRSGATHWVADRARPAGIHAGVFERRLRRMRMHGLEPLGLERAARLLREYGRPVRTGLIDAADRTWTTLLFLTEDGSTLVACAGRPPPPTAGESSPAPALRLEPPVGFEPTTPALQVGSNPFRAVPDRATRCCSA